MHRKSKFHIVVDFNRSFGAYVYDKVRQTYFLDFFSNYSSQPLGWNHPIFFTEQFRNEIMRVVAQKISLNEYITEEGEEFYKRFASDWAVHFTSSGSLAVEAAIKTAFNYNKHGKLIVLNNSFHGIYGYASFLSTSNRIVNLPSADWVIKVDAPVIQYEDKTQQLLDKYISQCERIAQSNHISAMLIEPIQCTNGDRYFPEEFFKFNREFCNKHDIVLIHDEVQTGFGVTGKFWYSENFPLPDIIVFGKKAQVAGILVNDKCSEIFSHPERLEVTFDGDLLDLIRCKYILRAYELENILENVNKQGAKLAYELKRIDGIKNVRYTGLLCAFDTEQNMFDKLTNKMNFLCLQGGNNIIRLRPRLNLTNYELNDSIERIKGGIL